MLYFDRIDVPEGVDFNKNKWIRRVIYVSTGISQIKFQPNFCNRCQDLLMMFMNLSNILNIKGSILQT